jgi:plasmid stabilization system protein ParE
MDRKLVWTETASADIEAIVRYIARNDSTAAARIGFGFYDRAQILLEHPDAGGPTEMSAVVVDIRAKTEAPFEVALKQ